MRRFLLSGAIAACALVILSAPSAGYGFSGQILSATADPCYRTDDASNPSTFTLHWTVLNTSSIDWGCSFCPAYAIEVVPSWLPGRQWSFYIWMDDRTSPSTGMPIRPGEFDSQTVFMVPSPPARSDQNWVDVILRAPVSTVACQYVVVDVVRVPIIVLEWPDLIIDGASFQPAQGVVGATIIRSFFRVKNVGQGPAIHSTYAEVRLSFDNQFDPGFDPFTGQQIDPWISSAYVPPLLPGQAFDFCTTGVVPDAPGGEVNVLFVCDVGTLDWPWDAGGEQEESPVTDGEDNNVFDTISRQGRGFIIQRPELVMTSGTINSGIMESAPNTPVSVEFIVRNSGGAPTAAPVTVSVNFSKDSLFGNADDIPGGSAAVGPILPGQSLTGVIDTASAPAAVGFYQVLLMADPGGAVNEYSGSLENNVLNLGRFLVTTFLAPDLLVLGGQVRPVYGLTNPAVDVDLRVQNNGDDRAPASQIGLYLVNAGQSLWVTSLLVPGLAPGQGHDISTRVGLPPGAPPYCSVTARCDIGGVVSESNENNNETLIGRVSLQTPATNWMLYK